LPFINHQNNSRLPSQLHSQWKQIKIPTLLDIFLLLPNARKAISHSQKLHLTRFPSPTNILQVSCQPNMDAGWEEVERMAQAASSTDAIMAEEYPSEEQIVSPHTTAPPLP
jgi:hypothetical protein